MRQLDRVLRVFSSGEVVRLTGIKFRTLDHWARTGFLIPSVAVATGTGSNRKYSFQDVVRLRAAKELRSLGVATSRIIEIIKSADGTIEAERTCVHVDLLGIAGDLMKDVRR